MAFGALGSVATGWAIAKLTGDCYSWQDAGRDALLGAAGAGLANKAVKLYRLYRARKTADLMRSGGQLGGELFPDEKIPALVKYLDKRGIFLQEATNGSCDGVNKVMTLPRNPTVLNVKHELSHFLDWKKYGDDYYTSFTSAQREQVVLDRLMNNRVWKQLNDAERKWSIAYSGTR